VEFCIPLDIVKLGSYYAVVYNDYIPYNKYTYYLRGLLDFTTVKD